MKPGFCARKSCYSHRAFSSFLVLFRRHDGYRPDNRKRESVALHNRVQSGELDVLPERDPDLDLAAPAGRGGPLLNI